MSDSNDAPIHQLQLRVSHANSSSLSSSTSVPSSASSTSSSSLMATNGNGNGLRGNPTSSSVGEKKAIIRAAPIPPSPLLVEYVACYGHSADTFSSTGQGAATLLDHGSIVATSLICRAPAINHDRIPNAPFDRDFPLNVDYFAFPNGIKFYRQKQASFSHSFVLTLGNGRRLYGMCHTMSRSLTPSQLSIVRMQLASQMMRGLVPEDDLPTAIYAPVAVTLLTAYPFHLKFIRVIESFCNRFCADGNVNEGTAAAMWNLLKVRAPVPGGRPSIITLPYVTEPLPLISVPDTTNTTSSNDSSSSSGGSSALSPSAVSPSSSSTVVSTSSSSSVSKTATRSTSSNAPSMLAQELLKQREAAHGHGHSNDGNHTPKSPRSPSATMLATSPHSPPPICACGVISCSHGQMQSSSLSTLDPSMPSASWDFSLPATSRAPLMDLELSVLFEHLAPSHIITLINCILCEFNVVCISSRLSILTPALESLMILLYPLQWPFTYIPLLPTALNGVLGSPVPFIVGCLTEALDDLPCMPDNAVIVDLDNNQIHAPPDPAGQPPPSMLQHSPSIIAIPAGNGRTPSKSATLPAGSGMGRGNGNRASLPSLSPSPTPPSPGLTALLHHSAQSSAAMDSFRRLPWRMAWRLYDAITKHFNVFAQAHPHIQVNPPYYLPANARARRQGPQYDAHSLSAPSPRGGPFSPGFHPVHESSGSSSGSDTRHSGGGGSGNKSSSSSSRLRATLQRQSTVALPVANNGVPVAAVMSIRTANVMYSGTSSDDSDPSGPERRYTNGSASNPGSPSRTPPISPRGSIIGRHPTGVAVSAMASAAEEKVNTNNDNTNGGSSPRLRTRSPSSGRKKKVRSSEQMAAHRAAHGGRPHSNSFDETSGSRYMSQYIPSSRHTSRRTESSSSNSSSSTNTSNNPAVTIPPTAAVTTASEVTAPEPRLRAHSPRSGSPARRRRRHRSRVGPVHGRSLSFDSTTIGVMDDLMDEAIIGQPQPLQPLPVPVAAVFGSPLPVTTTTTAASNATTTNSVPIASSSSTVPSSSPPSSSASPSPSSSPLPGPSPTATTLQSLIGLSSQAHVTSPPLSRVGRQDSYDSLGIASPPPRGPLTLQTSQSHLLNAAITSPSPAAAAVLSSSTTAAARLSVVTTTPSSTRSSTSSHGSSSTPSTTGSATPTPTGANATSATTGPTTPTPTAAAPAPSWFSFLFSSPASRRAAAAAAAAAQAPANATNPTTPKDTSTMTSPPATGRPPVHGQTPRGGVNTPSQAPNGALTLKPSSSRMIGPQLPAANNTNNNTISRTMPLPTPAAITPTASSSANNGNNKKISMSADSTPSMVPSTPTANVTATGSSSDDTASSDTNDSFARDSSSLAMEWKEWKKVHAAKKASSKKRRAEAIAAAAASPTPVPLARGASTPIGTARLSVSSPPPQQPSSIIYERPLNVKKLRSGFLAVFVSMFRGYQHYIMRTPVTHPSPVPSPKSRKPPSSNFSSPVKGGNSNETKTSASATMTSMTMPAPPVRRGSIGALLFGSGTKSTAAVTQEEPPPPKSRSILIGGPPPSPVKNNNNPLGRPSSSPTNQVIATTTVTTTVTSTTTTTLTVATTNSSGSTSTTSSSSSTKVSSSSSTTLTGDDEEYRTTFDYEGFELQVDNDDDRPFIRRVLHSQMFHAFVQERCHHIRSQQPMPSSASASASSSNVQPLADWFDISMTRRMKRRAFATRYHRKRRKTGMLIKMGTIIRSWKERFFILDGLNLRYYKPQHRQQLHDCDERVKKLRRLIALDTNSSDRNHVDELIREQKHLEMLRHSLAQGHITLVEGATRINIPDIPHKKYHTPHVFEVITPNRTLQMCADSPQARREWIKVIRARTTSSSASALYPLLNGQYKRAKDKDHSSSSNENTLPIAPVSSQLQSSQSQSQSSSSSTASLSSSTNEHMRSKPLAVPETKSHNHHNNHNHNTNSNDHTNNSNNNSNNSVSGSPTNDSSRSAANSASTSYSMTPYTTSGHTNPLTNVTMGGSSLRSGEASNRPNRFMKGGGSSSHSSSGSHYTPSTAASSMASPSTASLPRQITQVSSHRSSSPSSPVTVADSMSPSSSISSRRSAATNLSVHVPSSRTHTNSNSSNTLGTSTNSSSSHPASMISSVGSSAVANMTFTATPVSSLPTSSHHHSHSHTGRHGHGHGGNDSGIDSPTVGSMSPMESPGSLSASLSSTLLF